MAKNWALRKIDEAGPELKSYPELVQKLLISRGFKTASEAEIFLNPNYERDLLNPFLLKDMEKAVERFLEAIKNEERIVIWGDYDADGVPGAVVIASFLQKINYQNFDVYIPDRHNESYGLNLEAITELANKETKLIITVDCGVTDIAEVALAKEKGVDVIITDHHLVGEKLPEAYAVVDAKREDDQYPYKFLAGAGVAFKFVCAVLSKNRFEIAEGWEKWLLDLVAVATITDMVSQTGENRLLTYYGLKVLRQTRRLGLLALFDVIKTKPAYVTEDDISFMLGPRINSASRMSHASQAYYLLMTKKETEAKTIAKHLEDKNKERRDSVEIIIKEVAEKLATEASAEKLAIIVLGSDDWSLGVLGLTCSRLVEKYNCPVWLWAKNGVGEIKGSCRSDGSVNVTEVMRLANDLAGGDLFLDCGGHPMAGGFSLLPGQESELRKKMLEAYEQVEKKDVGVELLADEVLTIDQITWATYKQIEPFAPFGIDNPKLVFWLKDLEIFEAKYFGNGGLHLELVFQKSDGSKVSAIGFFASPVPNDPSHIFGDIKLEKGEKVDLLASLEKSMFKNYPELRLRIVDVHPVK